MELQDLRVFVTVAEELHFGRAAVRLHLAQPPVTRIVQHLERELGVVLFDRSSRSVRLTSAGAALLGSARGALAAADAVVITAERCRAGLAGRVRLGYVGLSATKFVATLAAEVSEQLPAVELSLSSRLYSQRSSKDFNQPVMGDVLNGGLDLGIGRWDVIPPFVDTQIVLSDRLVIAMPRHHRLAGSSSVSMAELRAESFVSLPQHAGSVVFDRLQRLCLAAGFSPNIVQIAPDTATALSLVAAGLGCALIFSAAADAPADPGVAFVELSDPVEMVPLRLAWRTNHDNPAIEPVLAVAADIVARAAGGDTSVR